MKGGMAKVLMQICAHWGDMKILWSAPWGMLFDRIQGALFVANLTSTGR